MSDVLSLPEIPPYLREQRKPMTLLDHARAAGFKKSLIIGLNTNGELIYLCDETLQIGELFWMVESIKHQFLGPVKS